MHVSLLNYREGIIFAHSHINKNLTGIQNKMLEIDQNTVTFKKFCNLNRKPFS